MRRLMNFWAATGLLLATLAAPNLAHAQAAQAGAYGAPVSYSATIGTTAVQVLPPAIVRYHVSLNNVSTGTAVWCSYQSVTPAANTAGSFLLAPGGATPIDRSIINNFLNINALWCVAASASTPITASAFPK